MASAESRALLLAVWVFGNGMVTWFARECMCGWNFGVQKNPPFCRFTFEWGSNLQTATTQFTLSESQSRLDCTPDGVNKKSKAFLCKGCTMLQL
jgi:hypothetical protein